MMVQDIDAGQFDRRITLLTRVTVPSNTGSTSYDWSTQRADLWAKKEDEASTSKYPSSDTDASENGVTIIIRHRPCINDRDNRIILDGETYEIVGNPVEIGRKQYLRIRLQRFSSPIDYDEEES